MCVAAVSYLSHFFFLGNHKVDSYGYGYEDYSLENQVCWYDVQVSAVAEEETQHLDSGRLQICHL